MEMMASSAADSLNHVGWSISEPKRCAMNVTTLATSAVLAPSAMSTSMLVRPCRSTAQALRQKPVPTSSMLRQLPASMIESTPTPCRCAPLAIQWNASSGTQMPMPTSARHRHDSHCSCWRFSTSARSRRGSSKDSIASAR